VHHEEHFPIADYDQLPEGDLQHKIRSLTADELRQVLDYEQRHANRVPVVQLLSERHQQLDEGATPSSGNPRTSPERPEASRHGSAASPSGSAEPGTPLRYGKSDQTPNRG
jgi:hypothetical protein